MEESGCDYECSIDRPHTHYVEYHPWVRDPRPVPPHCPPGTDRCLSCQALDIYAEAALESLMAPLFLSTPPGDGRPVRLLFWGDEL